MEDLLDISSVDRLSFIRQSSKVNRILLLWEDVGATDEKLLGLRNAEHLEGPKNIEETLFKLNKVKKLR